jgi:hypothetical protein
MRATPILIALSLLLLAAACVAQDVPEITGTVTLMNGDTYTGVIEVAEFGVKEGAGIGSDPQMDHGYMSVLVDGQETKVPFAEIAAADAKWAPPGPEPGSKWHIESITITRRDGSQVVGAPHWMLCATTARVRQADGTIARAYAFASASPDFKPDLLLTKIEIGAAGETVTTPPGETTTPPGETTPPPGEITTPPGETTTPPGETTTPPGETTTPPGETTTPPGPAVVGAPSQLTLTVICPTCGEKITVQVDVSAKGGK